jgi:hypothetical protein
VGKFPVTFHVLARSEPFCTVSPTRLDKALTPLRSLATAKKEVQLYFIYGIAEI